MSTFAIRCVICDEPVCTDSGLPRWMGNFRAVYTESQPNAARISRLGEVVLNTDLMDFEAIIPFDGPFSVDMNEHIINGSSIRVNLKSVPFYGGNPSLTDSTSSPLWGFPFHNSCWDLLSVAASQSGVQLDAPVLFGLCWSDLIQPGRLEALNKGNEPRKRQVLLGRVLLHASGRLRAHASRKEYKHDPFHIPELSKLFRLGEPCLEVALREKNQTPITRCSIDGDPLGVLPVEILVDILIRLDSKDVATLREASRAFANAGLPDKFWKSRFWPGGEFSHVFEALTHGHAVQGWKDLFCEVKSIKDLPSMKNRKRVLASGSVIRDLVGLAAINISGCGSPSHSLFEPSEMVDRLDWGSAMNETYAACKSVDLGPRPGYHRSTPVPVGNANILVSTVQLNGKSYISGIQFVSKQGQKTSLGYPRPENEIPVVWEHSQQGMPISGFHAAFDEYGIRGLAVIAQSKAISGWIGEHHSLAKKRFVISAWDKNVLAEVKYIRARFDVLKCVEISVSGGSEDLECHRMGASPSLRDSATWYPEIPGPRLFITDNMVSQYSDSQRTFPLEAALFGGEYGQYLPYISEIRVWTYAESDAFGSRSPDIWALQVKYDREVEGKREMALGRVIHEWSCDDHRIPLDSIGGERLTRLEPQLDANNTMLSCRVWIPPSAYAMEGASISEDPSPDGHMVVGIFAGLEPEAIIKSIGMLSIPSPMTAI
ncbi:Fc.00g041860.m01.CDS01 [Cosmosporella sp. VM-42]